MELTTKRTEKTNWGQVKALAAEGSMKVGDEIADELLNGEKITYVVAHITGEEVYLISRDCLGRRVQWNESGTNAGGFKESSLCRFLNETVWNMLPEELREVISEREYLKIVDGEESRYHLKLWLPTEGEVFGSRWKAGREKEQIEIFKDSRNVIKEDGTGNRCEWWLMSEYEKGKEMAWSVDVAGWECGRKCNRELHVLICFSISTRE